MIVLFLSKLIRIICISRFSLNFIILITSLIRLLTVQHDEFTMGLAFIAHIQIINDDGTPADRDARPGLDHLLVTTCRVFVVQCQQTGIKRDRSGAETSSTEYSSSLEDIDLLLHQLSCKGGWVINDMLLDKPSKRTHLCLPGLFFTSSCDSHYWAPIVSLSHLPLRGPPPRSS